MKKILITGKNSYVGNSFYDYMTRNFPSDYMVDKISLRNINFEKSDTELYNIIKKIKGYDVIFHVAGIAHSDYGKISEEKAKEYYNINTNLTIKLAKIAKENNVKQFIFMSSIIVYGDSAPIGVKKIIDRNTLVRPKNAYGESKLKAEYGLRLLNDENFIISIIRSPLVYGPDCKGNYKMLEKFACTLPFFPYVENERSVININKLNEFVKKLIDSRESGVFFPQDDEYMRTSIMVKNIAEMNGRKIYLIKGFSLILKILAMFMPVVNKAFGNIVYDKNLIKLELDK